MSYIRSEDGTLTAKRGGGGLVSGLSAIGPEAGSFFSEEGNRPRIGQAFIAIDPRALAGMERYFERVETVVSTMLADPEVRLPGARRFAAEKSARSQGLEIPEDLLAQIEKLAQQTG